MDPIDPLRPAARPVGPAARPDAAPAAPGPDAPAPGRAEGDALATAGGAGGPDALAALVGGAAAEVDADELDAVFGRLDAPAPAVAADLALIERLAAQPLGSAEAQAAMGRAAARLAAEAPGRLTPAAWAAFQASGAAARAFMAGLAGLSRAQRAAALGGVPVDVRKAMIDGLGTDGEDLEANGALLASLTRQDPELAGEVVAWGGPALARAAVDQLDDDALAAVDPGLLGCLRDALGGPDARQAAARLDAQLARRRAAG